MFCFLAVDTCVGPGLKDNEVLCGNGEVRTNWNCGPTRGYRVACPPNQPYLCAKKNDCANGHDQCCQKEASGCDNKGGIAEVCSVKTAIAGDGCLCGFQCAFVLLF